MMKRMVVAAVVVVCGAVGMRAQMGSAAMPKIGPGTKVEPAKTFDAGLTQFETEMVGLAKAMPAEKYGFVPSAAVFVPGQTTKYDGVRSFGAMVAHEADGNYYYAAALSGLKVDVDLKAIAALKDKDQIVKALEDSFAFSHKAMQTLTEKNAFESVHETATRASLAGELVAHGFDHYGQLVEYLRMNGIVPPASVRK